MTIENIKEIMDGVDIASWLPDLQSVGDLAVKVAWIALFIGPVLLLGLGLHYFLLAPKEANYTTGYRFSGGMGSVKAWRFMQQLAGAVWSLLGLGLLIAMSIANAGMAELKVMDLLWETLGYLALQVVLTLVSCGVINLVVWIRYDHKGNRRLTWREMNEA